MELSELTAYAGEKYQIREQHNWADLPGLSVLCHPQTGKWIAVLMRQWDTETGTQLERCDLKCGRESLSGSPLPFLSAPVRMFGSKWIGIAFDERTDRDTVYRLFDRTVEAEAPHGYTFVLPSQPAAAQSAYRETALPFAGSTYRPATERIPDRLREMRRMYVYGSGSEEARAKNFYRQAVFMQDYEDDVPWSGDFNCYFPTYHDLSVQQLRGYFTWRTSVRKGVFEPIAISCAYIYIYELLNGIGTRTPEEALDRLLAFEAGYLDAGFGDKRMRQNLRRWMLEYAVMHGLPQERARQAADPEMLERDAAIAVLKTAGTRSDEEVFAALCTLGGKKTAASPVLTNAPERGRHLFSEAWRTASAYHCEKKNLFTLCFGRKKVRRWYPLANAVVHAQGARGDREYVLDECRAYACRNGLWQVTAFEKLSFDRSRFAGFLHETDAALRRYLKTGRYLKEDPANGWAVPYILAVIEADKQAQREASKREINIDLTGLERIRKDAETTRDSLLTEEETEGCEETEETADALPEPERTDLPLDSVQIQILRTLLRGGDAVKTISDNHMMLSVATDFINEALFDEIGDNVLLLEDGRLTVVEDYVEDLEQLLGGSANG